MEQIFKDKDLNKAFRVFENRTAAAWINDTKYDLDFHSSPKISERSWNEQKEARKAFLDLLPDSLKVEA